MQRISHSIRPLALSLMVLALGSAAPQLGFSQDDTNQAMIKPNYREADIRTIVEAVSEVTGKNFVIDPRVKAQVTMLSSSPMSPDAFYETFLSILQVHGFVAVPAGNVIKILPDANARQVPGSPISARGDQIVTHTVMLRNVGAAQLVPILRPLIPQYGHLAAHPASNMLIISDRAANVSRLRRIISRIDQAGDEEIEVIPMEHATATQVVAMLAQLSQAAQAAGGAPPIQFIADERTNSILISGAKNARLRFRALISHLDTPTEEGGDTKVRYLNYSDAADLATKLQAQFSGASGAPGAGGAAAPIGPISIWADEDTNALIINAPPEVTRDMMAVVDKLDIRRAQVLVEAIIVEVTADKSADLGITWFVEGINQDNPIGITNFSNTTGVGQLGGALAGGGGDDSTGGLLGAISGAALPDGITLGVGRIQDTGTNFAAILNAFRGDAETNIISTPTIVTMDNQEAEIRVGQEVPFLTGSFSNTGGNNNGSVNPFQTIQREEVGTSLKITPQINEGTGVLLKIEQETSSISQSAGAVDLITNNRTISTSVFVDDSEILVLGGLIDDTVREQEQRVPILGSIPILGALFRSRSTEKLKTNLMVFIRPTILRDGIAARFETNSKYNYVRDLQLQQSGQDPALLKGEGRPLLPPLEEYNGTPPVETQGSTDGG
jgi:general secretion pathway protein D